MIAPRKDLSLRALRPTLAAALMCGMVVLSAVAARGQAPVADAPGAPAGEVFEPGEILAIVGDQYILAADVLPHVNQVLEQYRGKVPEEQLQQQRRGIVAQLTASHIEVKILYLAFLRKVPAEKVPEVHKKLGTKFDTDLEEMRRKIERADKDKQLEILKKDPQLARLVLLMKDQGTWSPAELDSYLRRFGGSLAQEKRYYIEYKLGQVITSQDLNFEPAISHDEMLRFYKEHEKDYLVPTRVRFEIMSVRFTSFRTKEEAFAAICAMGNRVLGGARFDAVAKQSSQGLNAEQGGYHDWTPRGSLASKRLDEALFTIEPGKLSTVIEDERGYHILRVTERQEAGKIPFEEVQTAIREKIRQQKVGKQYKDLVVKLKAGATVWTAFDDDPVLSQAVRPSEQKKR